SISKSSNLTIKNCVINNWGPLTQGSIQDGGIRFVEGNYPFGKIFLINNSFDLNNVGISFAGTFADNNLNIFMYNNSFNNNNLAYYFESNDGSDEDSIYSLKEAEGNFIREKEFLFIRDKKNFSIENKSYGGVIVLNISNSLFDNISVVGGDGFLMRDCNNILVNNSFFNENSYNGIKLKGSNSSKIINCYANNNGLNINGAPLGLISGGIYLEESNNNTLINNNAIQNYAQWGGAGIFLGNVFCYYCSDCLNNKLLNNTIKRNYRGIDVLSDTSNQYVSSNILRGNIISNNNKNGIRLTIVDGRGFLKNNSIYNNILVRNNFEISFGGFSYSAVDNFKGNNIYNNFIYGSNLFFSEDEDYEDSFNYWNSSIKGNYWATSSNDGFSQTCTDDNDDGICDTDYDVFNNDTCTAGVNCSNNTDYMPLSTHAYANEFIVPKIKVIAPSSSTSISQNEGFNVLLNVTCLGRDCGNISVFLDPITGCDCEEGSCSDACGEMFLNETSEWTYDSNFLEGSGACKDDTGVFATIEDSTCDIVLSDPSDGDCVAYSTDNFNDPNNVDVCPSFDRRRASVSKENCVCNHADCEWFDFTSTYFAGGGAGSKGGLVNTTEGATPFYTNNSNPEIINLNEGESEIIEFWVNATGTLGNRYDFFAYTKDLNSFDINVTNSSSHWNVTILNETSQKSSIYFVDPTTNTGVYNGKNNIQANVSSNDSNLDEIVINLYNSSGLYQTNSTSFNTLFINYTNLSFGTYYLNATITDLSYNTNSTETRTIVLQSDETEDDSSEGGGGSSDEEVPPSDDSDDDSDEGDSEESQKDSGEESAVSDVIDNIRQKDFPQERNEEKYLGFDRVFDALGLSDLSKTQKIAVVAVPGFIISILIILIIVFFFLPKLKD
ncbi:MAG: right-handed parallel beta-helix repeat-containing protein, partial [bacterium]